MLAEDQQFILAERVTDRATLKRERAFDALPRRTYGP